MSWINRNLITQSTPYFTQSHESVFIHDSDSFISHQELLTNGLGKFIRIGFHQLLPFMPEINKTNKIPRNAKRKNQNTTQIKILRSYYLVQKTNKSSLKVKPSFQKRCGHSIKQGKFILKNDATRSWRYFTSPSMSTKVQYE